MSRRRARAAVVWMLAAAAAAVMAQPLPATQEIVDALKPVASQGVPATPPSLSLVIQFEPNTARVRPASGPALGNLVAALLAPELQGSRFVVEGHAAAGTSVDGNQRLSQQRADEVRLYLVALGVPAARLRAVGRGAGEAGAGADPQAAANTRVRVVAHE